jgi:AraC-like DNA-binding protein/TolB-like protein
MNGVNHTEDQFLQKITEIIDANLHNEHFGVTELAEQLGMSRITLHRKVKSVIQKSVSEFIREARLNRALELLRKNGGTVSEIAYKVGFGSVTYFNTSFHEHFGFTPGEVLKGLHPAVEVVETKPQPKQNQIFIKRRFFYFIIAVAAVLLLAVVLYQLNEPSEVEEQTIAILPFINDSGEEFAPFTTWMGIEIGNKLGKIENMLVVPQSTTEIYHDSKKSNREIARELMVDHLLRGRTIKTGDKILLNIELFEAKTDQPLFTEIYERDLDETEEASLKRIFEICEDVVFQISEVLQTDITYEEQELVAKKSTKNPEALQYFQLGNYLIAKNYLLPNTYDLHLYYDAKKAFETAVVLDSLYIDAYVQLAYIYIEALYPYTSGLPLAYSYLDSGLVMADKALMLDKNNRSANAYKRKYFLHKGMYAEAEKLEPFVGKGVKYPGYYVSRLADYYSIHDYYHFFEALSKYHELKSEIENKSIWIFNNEIWCYSVTGFPNLAKQRNLEKFKITNDTVLFETYNLSIESRSGNYQKVLELTEKNLKKYPNSIQFMYWEILIRNFLQDYNNALKAVVKLENALEKTGDSLNLTNYMYGITFLKNGMPDKANVFFKEAIKRIEEEINYNYWTAKGYIAHFNLARIYSVMNDRQKSLYYLGEMKKASYTFEYMIHELKNDPLFDNVRSEPEFQKITRELEKKYLEEHEKIRKLLISKGLEPA